MTVPLKRLFIALALVCLVIPAAPAAAQAPSATVLTLTSHAGGVDFQYPVVIALPDAAAQDKINAAIGAWVEKFRADTAGPFTETAMIRYQVHRNGGGKLSITLTGYTYSGGAHGMTYMKGMTFDLGNGREYRLADIIPYREGGRERIDGEIARQLGQRGIPLLAPFKGVKDDQDFYLDASGKPVVFFQLYELAAYVYGFLKFPLGL